MPRLTATLGLRYEYFTVLNERDSLELMPVIQGNAISTLLSDATLDFAGSSVGRPFYKPDRNNLAPNIGLAWDVFGKGKTALRAARGWFGPSARLLDRVVRGCRNSSHRRSSWGIPKSICSTFRAAVLASAFRQPRLLKNTSRA